MNGDCHADPVTHKLATFSISGENINKPENQRNPDDHATNVVHPGKSRFKVNPIKLIMQSNVLT